MKRTTGWRMGKTCLSRILSYYITRVSMGHGLNLGLNSGSGLLSAFVLFSAPWSLLVKVSIQNLISFINKLF